MGGVSYELCHGLEFLKETRPVNARKCVGEGFYDRSYVVYK